MILRRANVLVPCVAATLVSLMLVLLAPTPARSAFPAANGLIAYQGPTSTGYQVFTVQANGTANQRVTSGGQSFAPAFSPTGNRLAVYRDAGTQSGVWIVGLGAKWIRRVVPLPSLGAGGATAPAWSPDGQQIAFTRDYNLWVVGFDGSDPRPVLDPETSPAVYSPAWSPDGSRIAFTAFEGPPVNQMHVYTVGPDGTGMQQLTTGETSDPNWSPDGGRLAFVRYVRGNSDLWVVDADGTNGRAVTKTAATAGREIHPAWSPDGRRIVAYDQERGALFTIAPDGSGRRLVRALPQGSGAPDWQPETRTESSVTLNYSTASQVRANGQVNPNHGGQAVIVELAVKRGTKWVTVETKRPSLSLKSRYVVRFARRAQFMCQLTTRFPGDADHRPSSANKRFSC